MTNKITVTTIVRNEMDILPYTLPQSLKWADRVIVLDGGPEGTSTDGTWEYLTNLVHKTQYHNIVTGKDPELYIETGTYGSDHTLQNNWDRVMRQRYLDILADEDYEGWNFLIDADETYTDEDWQKIRDYVDQATEEEKVMIRFPYIYFFKDLNHIITGDGWDTPCHHLSIFRPGFQYLDVSTLIRDEVGHCITHYPSDQIMLVDDVTLYHYSHSANYEKERQRLFRYYKRGDRGADVAKTMPEKANEWDWEDPRNREVHEDKVKEFKGEHPAHMQEYVRKYNEQEKGSTI